MNFHGIFLAERRYYQHTGTHYYYLKWDRRKVCVRVNVCILPLPLVREEHNMPTFTCFWCLFRYMNPICEIKNIAKKFCLYTL